ncbi:hypothetical protein EDC04DRAFT_2901262 [Pisolithus marmoratus]|nr:hypothetical protein EDC04DRAFT_2901262 [Pisolithus marmoratus]
MAWRISNPAWRFSNPAWWIPNPAWRIPNMTWRIPNTTWGFPNMAWRIPKIAWDSPPWLGDFSILPGDSPTWVADSPIMPGDSPPSSLEKVPNHPAKRSIYAGESPKMPWDLEKVQWGPQALCTNIFLQRFIGGSGESPCPGLSLACTGSTQPVDTYKCLNADELHSLTVPFLKEEMGAVYPLEAPVDDDDDDDDDEDVSDEGLVPVPGSSFYLADWTSGTFTSMEHNIQELTNQPEELEVSRNADLKMFDIPLIINTFNQPLHLLSDPQAFLKGLLEEMDQPPAVMLHHPHLHPFPHLLPQPDHHHHIQEVMHIHVEVPIYLSCVRICILSLADMDYLPATL